MPGPHAPQVTPLIGLLRMYHRTRTARNARGARHRSRRIPMHAVPNDDDAPDHVDIEHLGGAPPALGGGAGGRCGSSASMSDDDPGTPSSGGGSGGTRQLMMPARAGPDGRGAPDGGEGRGARACVPERVHLIWSVRSLDELSILGPELLEEAMR